MGIDKEMIRPVKNSLHASNHIEVKPLGVIVLPIYAADCVLEVKFLVVDTPSAMIVIMGREWIYAVKGVVSTLHQVMRCQPPNGLYTIDIKGDQSQSRRCYSIESQGEEQREVRRMTKNQIEKFDRAKDVEEEVLEDDNAK